MLGDLQVYWNNNYCVLWLLQIQHRINAEKICKQLLPNYLHNYTLESKALIGSLH